MTKISPILLMTLITIMGFLAVPVYASSPSSGYSIAKNPYDAIQAYYTHSTGTVTAGGVVYSFSHSSDGTQVKFTAVGSDTTGGFLISKTTGGYLISNGEGRITITHENASANYPPVNYLAYVLYGVPNPNPGHGSHSECGSTWSSFLYGGSGPGYLKLTWNDPTPAFVWFYISCVPGFWLDGGWSVSGSGYSNSGSTPHSSGATGIYVGSSFTGYLSIAVTSDYGIPFPWPG